MRFWHKTLLIVLVVFIVALDASVIVIMKKSWQLNMERETQRAASEQALIANNIYENLNSIQSRGAAVNNKVLYDVASSYADYYGQQGITLQLWDDTQRIFPQEGAKAPISGLLNGQLEENGKHLLRTVNNLPSPYDHMLLVSQRDIEALYAQQQELNRYFVIIHSIVGPCLAVLLYFTIRQLTKPLRILSDTTNYIAGGNYAERVTLTNNDEFGELAHNFNTMAAAVEKHITELSGMAEEKQRIVDNLAHELRTPLTSMQGFAEYLTSAYINEEERMTASRYIWSETLRLKKLAFKLLDISVVRQRAIELKRVEVHKLFQSVEQTERNILEAAGQQLLIRSSIDSIRGDFDLLTSFLINCIDNAIHASAKGSHIMLQAYEQEQQAVLEVRDFGCGMSAEQAQRAFEPFYRADKARSSKHGGVGLGLPLCREIAEAHGATLRLDSHLNEGTSIRMILQLYNNSSQTP